MNFPQRRLLGWTVLLAFATLTGGWLLQIDYAKKISTDVLDLIPPGERDPELAVVRELASQAEARTMLFEVTTEAGAPAPLDAAQRFARALGASGAFTQAIALGDPSWRDALGRELFERRMPLLFPLWFKSQAAGADRSPERMAAEAAARLKTFLAAPEALAFQDLVPADPLLLMPAAVDRLKGGLALVQPKAATMNSSGLVWAQLKASPLTEAGQGPVFAAIEYAARDIDASVGPERSSGRGERGPRFHVAYTGVNRFAAASRARIEREVSWLNTLSLVAVLAVAGIFIRGVHRALHLVPAIILAVLGAWAATTAVFARVHVIVFVLGALLTGVAIDYGFYLYMQPPAAPGEDYWSKVRRLLKPLLASCFTTVTGFALLLFSELPMIRQLGIFVGAGLLCALGAAVVYFSTVRDPFLPARDFATRRRSNAPFRRRLRLAMIAGWAIALVGLTRIVWRDDIRELEIPAKELQTEDARIRAAFGQRSDRTVYLTHGGTLDEARASLGRLEHWLRGRAEFGNLGGIIPTQAEYTQAVRFAREHPEFPRALAGALEHEGFDAGEFGRFAEIFATLAASNDADLGRAVSEIQTKLAGPLGLLLHVGRETTWFVTVVGAVVTEQPPPDAHSVSASQLQTLNRLFANYRRSAVRLSLAGLGLVGLGVLLTYGVRDGLRIFAIPCGACLGIFGLLGWLGQPLNLFHLLGAFLGVCLTHNYSIFSATSAFRHEPPPVSVRLSALTTAASFGVLALSEIPVVRALGITVTAMVVAALLVIELEHLSPLANRGGGHE